MNDMLHKNHVTYQHKVGDAKSGADIEAKTTNALVDAPPLIESNPWQPLTPHVHAPQLLFHSSILVTVPPPHSLSKITVWLLRSANGLQGRT